MSYVGEEGESLGYEVELEVAQANFNALMPMLVSGRADIVSGSIRITEKQKRSINFATAGYTVVVPVVRAEDLGMDTAAAGGELPCGLSGYVQRGGQRVPRRHLPAVRSYPSPHPAGYERRRAGREYAGQSPISKRAEAGAAWCGKGLHRADMWGFHFSCYLENNTYLEVKS